MTTAPASCRLQHGISKGMPVAIAAKSPYGQEYLCWRDICISQGSCQRQAAIGNSVTDLKPPHPSQDTRNEAVTALKIEQWHRLP